MLPNHAPLVVAEEFSMLQGLYPGRIDLGVGRAKGTDPTTALALSRRGDHEEDFMAQLDELSYFLRGEFPAGHQYENVRISLDVDPPPIYILGSSESSAYLAASRGMPYAFAHHLNPKATNSALALYRSEFRSCGSLKNPYAIATVAVVCAPSQEEAKHAAIGATVVRIRKTALASQQALRMSDDVMQYPGWLDEELQLAERALAGGWLFVGTPDKVSMKLMELRQATGANELMLTTIEYDGASRIRTLEGISDAVCLTDP